MYQEELTFIVHEPLGFLSFVFPAFLLLTGASVRKLLFSVSSSNKVAFISQPIAKRKNRMDLVVGEKEKRVLFTESE